jgi:collagenase-like PrtC family protease
VRANLTIGPVLFHWPAEQKRDFYFRIADEAPVDTVCLGEVICSKRAPFFEPHYTEMAERLVSAGKKVVFSTLAETMTKRERKMIAGMCAGDEFPVEANDSAALYYLRGKPHWIGPYINVYNEDTLGFLAGYGATHVTLPPEMPAEALRVMGAAARTLDVSLEVQVYGRVPLALSARCYHARAHDRIKDNCQFVCEQDPDGMELKTLNGQPFLSINGIQTLSHTCLNLAREMKDLQAMGISAFRLSPHSGDMVRTAGIFRALADDRLSPAEAVEQLGGIGLGVPFSNGFYHKREGYQWVGAPEGGDAQSAHS